MPLEILIHGKRLDPRDGAAALLPLDPLLRCPGCNGDKILSTAPKTTTQLDGEARRFIPRQQDRHCLECGARWTAVCPPEEVALGTLMTGRSR